jgi:glycogen operon protein
LDASARRFVPSAVQRGRAAPLGADWDGAGVNFALYSQNAERVELCLFDERGQRELERIELAERTDFVWHCYLPEARPGLRYGYRVHGPHAPERGHRFNAHRVLLDPYARLVLPSGTGRSQVVDAAFSWGEDRPPRVPWADSVIYEAHVKGFTKLHPEVPEPLRGTFGGLASAPALEHLKRLGVTAVELLPVQAFADERRLAHHGLTNYWGYNTIGFFAPDLRYCSQSGPPFRSDLALGEFKTMVKTLHSAGIEVILDVVYNHTAEGDHLGPTLSFRGIDNAVYYRLDPHDPRHYLDYAGTGNSLNTAHPAVLALVMDSLRYWVQEMHVDGFRFDLATTLARNAHGRFDPLGAFLGALHQDPVLSHVKLIAEPWDVGEGGYRLGGFPPRWAEWNDRYRDTVRAYWRGDGGQIRGLAGALAGSAEVFEASGRGPTASLNFVAAHDGFTLHDLVSYDAKHNEANHEDNRDGPHDNKSWNCGVEGPTADPGVTGLRERQKRNLLATLLFSHGVPMLVAGDEMGRTQLGNNNAYCQDGELSWVHWELDAPARELLHFTREAIRLRKSLAELRRDAYAGGIAWLTPQGNPMGEEDWQMPFARCIGARFGSLLLLLNAHDERIDFGLPEGSWELQLDTSRQALARIHSGDFPLQGRSLALLVTPSS